MAWGVVSQACLGAVVLWMLIHQNRGSIATLTDPQILVSPNISKSVWFFSPGKWEHERTENGKMDMGQNLRLEANKLVICVVFTIHTHKYTNANMMIL